MATEAAKVTEHTATCAFLRVSEDKLIEILMMVTATLAIASHTEACDNKDSDSAEDGDVLIEENIM